LRDCFGQLQAAVTVFACLVLVWSLALAEGIPPFRMHQRYHLHLHFSLRSQKKTTLFWQKTPLKTGWLFARVKKMKIFTSVGRCVCIIFMHTLIFLHSRRVSSTRAHAGYCFLRLICHGAVRCHCLYAMRSALGSLSHSPFTSGESEILRFSPARGLDLTTDD